MISGNSRRPGRFFSRDRGAALMEAALVMPLMLMLTVGVWTTARAWNVHSTLDHAAREAARYGATEVPFDGTSPAEVRAVADQVLQASAIRPVRCSHRLHRRGQRPVRL